METSNNITFQGKLGKNVLRYAQKEFGYKAQKISKFAKLYEDTFSKNIDENTIVDLSADKTYIFSNTKFPNIEYFSDKSPEMKGGILKSLLRECPKTLARIENKLFRKIISESLKLGVTLRDLQSRASGIKNSKSKENFLDNLKLAKHIIEENPNSKLENWEFDAMSNKLMQREAETPGTELYEMVHSLDKINFQ